jgi:hypothetical protein
MGSVQRLFSRDSRDFQPMIERYGYRPIVTEPKYRDPIVQEYGINPTFYHLFELDTQDLG